MKNKLSISMLTLALTISSSASSIEFILQGGQFYGPGDGGVHSFPLGSLKGFVPTGPLEGFIPFENNGGDAPNIIAESQQIGGIVDGALSDGTLLNENLNNGFILNTDDPVNGKVSTLVAAIEGGPFDGEEIFNLDEKGNMVLHVYSAFDSGDPSTVAKAMVRPTTGAVRVPLSVKTQLGLEGGKDFAGPYKSGRVFVGRVGDFDLDGYMDGSLMLAEVSALGLPVAEGDPVYFFRPFTSDIPISSKDAISLTLNGVIQNFLEPVIETITAEEYDITLGYLSDITLRIDSALANLHVMQETGGFDNKVERAKRKIVRARSIIDMAVRVLEISSHKHKVIHHTEKALEFLASSHEMLQHIE